MIDFKNLSDQQRLGNAVSYGAMLLVLMYGCFLALFSTSEFPKFLNSSLRMPYLFDKPVGEDGFYMLMVAWNIATGEGVTGNFSQPVTGIQPLSTFIYAGIGWLVSIFGGNKEVFVRAILLFGAANISLFSHLIGVIASRFSDEFPVKRSAYVLAVLITASSFHVFRVFTYGLETGIYLTLVALVILRSFDFLNQGRGGVLRIENVVFGLMIGLAGLARIDFGVVYAIFFAFAAIFYRSRVPGMLVAGIIAAITISPWIIYVWMVSGSPVPSSGPAQGSLVTLQSLPWRLLPMMNGVIQNLSPWFYTGGRWDVASASTITIVAFYFIFIHGASARGERNISWQMHKNLGVARIWLVTLVSLAAAYIILIHAAHFYDRYMAPLMTIAIPLSAFFMARHFLVDKTNLMKSACYIGLPIVFIVFSIISLHTGKIGNSHSISAGYIKENFSEEKMVGAFQSGVIGYVNSNVVNLDGKVNIDVLPSVKRGNIEDYLENNKELRVIIDWPVYIEGFISRQYLEKNWRKCDLEIPTNSSICFVRLN